MGTQIAHTVVSGRPMESAGGAARERAFADMLDRHVLDDAYRYATLLLGDRTEAEDATHDAALAAWRHFGELRDPARFDAWFGRILVNACRDRLRQRRRHPVPLEAIGGHGAPHEGSGAAADRGTWSSSGGRSADPAEAIARRAAFTDALRSLSPEHREVIVLRYYSDLTVEQIAARTGVGAGTVKSRLHYALRRLRAAAGEPDEEGAR